MINIIGGTKKRTKLYVPLTNVRPTSSQKRGSIFSILESYASKNNINIYTPSEGLAYQEIKMLDISWQTKGWIPMVDIFLSVDSGSTWEKIASDIKNSGKFSWWNNLIIGEKFYIKIVDSYNQNNSIQELSIELSNLGNLTKNRDGSISQRSDAGKKGYQISESIRKGNNKIRSLESIADSKINSANNSIKDMLLIIIFI